MRRQDVCGNVPIDSSRSNDTDVTLTSSVQKVQNHHLLLVNGELVRLFGVLDSLRLLILLSRLLILGDNADGANCLLLVKQSDPLVVATVEAEVCEVSRGTAKVIETRLILVLDEEVDLGEEILDGDRL